MAYCEGEVVLCYQGELLYEAKILKCSNGGASDEISYLMHYKGWSKKWDEWVPEDRLLKHNATNLKLQEDLEFMAKGTSKAKSNNKTKSPVTLVTGDVSSSSSPASSKSKASANSSSGDFEPNTLQTNASKKIKKPQAFVSPMKKQAAQAHKASTTGASTEALNAAAESPQNLPTAPKQEKKTVKRKMFAATSQSTLQPDAAAQHSAATKRKQSNHNTMALHEEDDSAPIENDAAEVNLVDDIDAAEETREETVLTFKPQYMEGQKALFKHQNGLYEVKVLNYAVTNLNDMIYYINYINNRELPDEWVNEDRLLPYDERKKLKTKKTAAPEEAEMSSAAEESVNVSRSSPIKALQKNAAKISKTKKSSEKQRKTADVKNKKKDLKTSPQNQSTDYPITSHLEEAVDVATSPKVVSPRIETPKITKQSTKGGEKRKAVESADEKVNKKQFKSAPPLNEPTEEENKTVTNFAVGEKIRCIQGPKIYDAKVLAYAENDMLYLVHYNGWNKKHDEWVVEERMLKFDTK